jgi:hypothetical protein
MGVGRVAGMGRMISVGRMAGAGRVAPPAGPWSAAALARNHHLPVVL